MKPWRFLTVLLVTAFLLIPVFQGNAAPTTEPSAQAGSDIHEAITTAVMDSMEKHTDVLAFQLFHMQVYQIFLAEDEKQAVVWLAAMDEDSGDVVAAEPALAIANLVGEDPTQPSAWKITLQADEAWNDVLSSVPETLITREHRETYMSPAISVEPQTFHGYKLPWAAGNSKRLTQSIGHKYIYGNCPSCLWAFDFADSTMFPILAAKGGTVYSYNWDCPNNNHTCVNYLILKDASTSPTTYQIYYHLAYNSIPADLKVLNTPVIQGQYIGNTDNTGASTGHHLHYQVTTSLYNNWGTSVDFTFDDVDINGGRPRQCIETELNPSLEGWYPDCHDDGDWFTSGNAGANPPSGDLGLPWHGAVLQSSQLTVTGSGWDDRAVTKMQVIARWDDKWREIGSPQTANPFTTTIDLCASGIPNGPVDLALRVWDYEGNLSPGLPGLRGIYNNANCLLPTGCQPASDQVALFSDPGYRGACELFSSGTYYSNSLGEVGNNATDSVLVGGSVRAVLYDDSTVGRPDALEWSDANLADNRLGGVNRLSSLIVEPRSTAPGAPSFDDILSPSGSTTPTSNDSLVFSWWRGSATEFSAALTGPVNLQRNWDNLNNWSIGSLPAGTYSLTVQARNSGGTAQGTKSFTVVPASLPDPGQQTVPYSTDFEGDNSDWTATSFWRNYEIERDGSSSRVFGYNNGSGYYTDNPEILRGDLTSPPILLPAGSSWLRFDTLMDSESNYPFWDRRIVQISVNGGRFTDLYEMQADPPDYWTQSPAIDLSGYASQVVRIRFHFDAVEWRYNTGQGWLVDHVSITTTPPIGAGCAETSNNSLPTASTVTLGQTISATICSTGDLDYYTFTGQAGQVIGINVDAQSLGSNLDAVLYLYDSNGRLMEMMDDEVYATIRDPLINYVLPTDGRYYFHIQAWNHPGAGGEDYFYQVSLIGGGNRPSLALTNPSSGGWAPQGNFYASANVQSYGTTISQVSFYWHPADWEAGSWIHLGTDADGSDGWSAPVVPAELGEIIGSAIYARVTDVAGNQSGDMRIIMNLDGTPPAASFQAPANPHPGTAVQVGWSVTDGQSGLNHSELEYQVNGGTWQILDQSVPPTKTREWAFGNFGQSIAFRLRGIDNVGNIASWVSTSTVVESTCTPDWYDQNANEDLPAGAVPLPILTIQEHNLCSFNDADWVRITVTEAKTLLVRADSISGGAAVNLELYDSSGSQLLARTSSPGLGMGAAIVLPISQPGVFLLKVTPLDSRLAGTGVRYNLHALIGNAYYLPVLSR